MGAFQRFDLRTTDPEAARAFYADVARLEVTDEDGTSVIYSSGNRIGLLVELPARARERGAPSHWLGYVGATDPESAVRHFTEAGGESLGALETDGATLVRDAQGAVFAIAAPEEGPGLGAVRWHELHTTDYEAAWSVYSDCFEWRLTEALQLGGAIGTYQMFAGGPDLKTMGAFANTARAPHMHTHWLYYFQVPDVDASFERAEALGAKVLGRPMDVWGGNRVAGFEDPQGAVFGIWQSP